MLTALLCLANCATMTRILEIDPPGPTQTEAVRILCAKSKEGFFIYGPVYYHESDTEITKALVAAHNDAWDSATQKGQLCGGVTKPNFGEIPFGKTTWGSVE